jgi:hypothetical protein
MLGRKHCETQIEVELWFPFQLPSRPSNTRFNLRPGAARAQAAKCRVSAKSGLVLARIPNDRTEVTQPVEEPDDQNQPGPKLPVTSQRNSGSKNLGQVRLPQDFIGLRSKLSFPLQFIC